MRRVLILCFAALASPAFSEEAKQYVPPPIPAGNQYAPIIIDEAEYKQLRTWIDEQPTKFGLPLTMWLNNLESKAVEARDKALEKKKKDEEAKKTEELKKD